MKKLIKKLFKISNQNNEQWAKDNGVHEEYLLGRASALKQDEKPPQWPVGSLQDKAYKKGLDDFDSQVW